MKKQTPKKTKPQAANRPTYDALTSMAKRMFINAENKEKEKKNIWQQ